MTKALDDESGVACCECGPPGFSTCCTVACPGPQCDAPFCCFFRGMRGTVHREDHQVTDILCCGLCSQPCEPQCCAVSVILPNTTTWDMEVAGCTNGYALFLVVPGVGDYHCWWPFWFVGTWQQLNPFATCGFCIPCPFGGSSSHPVVGHCFRPPNQPLCGCFALQTHECCIGQNPGELCPFDELGDFFFGCYSWTVTCVGNVRTCSGFPNCISACMAGVLGTTLTFITQPDPCHLCEEINACVVGACPPPP